MNTVVTKLKVAMVTILTALVIVPAPLAVAVDITGTACDGISESAVCKDSSAGQKSNPIYGPDGAITKVISVLSIVLAVIAFIVIIVAGIKFATSGGDPAKVSSARNTIIYAAIGVVVAGLAQAIVNLVLKKL